MNKYIYTGLILILSVVLIAGCGGGGGSSTGAVPNPTSTVPTSIPVPTVNPVPTVPTNVTEIPGQEITIDTTWSLANSPYLVTGSIYIRDGARLTVEAGVTVYFQGSTGIFVGKSDSGGESSYQDYYQGALSAAGTSSNPITFTSYNAISSSVASPGSWYGIYFGDGTMDGSSTLDYCNISYGGQTYTDSSYNFTMSANVGCRNSSPGISNSQIGYSFQEGIHLMGSSPTITANTISNNGGYGIKAEAYNSEKSTPTITGNSITNNNYPLRIGCQECPRAGNTISSNTNNVIDIIGGEIVQDVTWDITGLPYIINNPVYVRDNATFTINSGVDLRFKPSTGIFVGKSDSGGESSYQTYFLGALNASNVTFTSSSSSPSPGSWYGIYFGDGTIDGSSTLDSCTISYAGQSYTDSSYSFTMQSNVGCRYSSPGISNCTISYSGLHGIQLRNDSDPSITSNNINNNAGYGIWYTTTCSPTVTGSTYSNNTSGNVYSAGSD